MSRHEKKRQTGLLDTFFGRPNVKNTKGNNNNNGGTGRPLSSGEASSEAPDFISRLDEKEVNDRFLELLDDMNIPKDKRGPLLQKGIEERRKMLLMHVKGEAAVAGGISIHVRNDVRILHGQRVFTYSLDRAAVPY